MSRKAGHFLRVGEYPLRDKDGKNTGRFGRIIRLSMTLKENKRKARREIHEKACQMFKRVFENLSHIDEVQIQINPPNPDETKRFTNVIMKMTMTRTTAEQIKWSKFKAKELPKVLESYWVAPELGKESK
ncbi:hypothetical protein [[Eubacterium] cellulosolvens]